MKDCDKKPFASALDVVPQRATTVESIGRDLEGILPKGATTRVNEAYKTTASPAGDEMFG